MIFQNRAQAGRLLASKLSSYKGKDVVVLALPRGGVPVGAEISKTLNVPLNVLAVRKVGAPFNPELGLGAICEDIDPVLSDDLLSQVHLTRADLADIVKSEKKEIERQIRKFRKGKELINLSGKTAIVVDDGLATGATVMAAIKFLRGKAVSKIVVAVPITAASSARKVRAKVDEFVAVEESEDLLAVGYWYKDFDPVSDDEVLSFLKRRPRRVANYPMKTK